MPNDGSDINAALLVDWIHRFLIHQILRIYPGLFYCITRLPYPILRGGHEKWCEGFSTSCFGVVRALTGTSLGQARADNPSS